MSMTLASQANDALLVVVSYAGTAYIPNTLGSSGTVTWNGVGMTQIASEQTGGVSSKASLKAFWLNGPASGTHNVVSSWTNALIDATAIQGWHFYNLSPTIATVQTGLFGLDSFGAQSSHGTIPSVEKIIGTTNYPNGLVVQGGLIFIDSGTTVNPFTDFTAGSGGFGANLDDSGTAFWHQSTNTRGWVGGSHSNVLTTPNSTLDGGWDAGTVVSASYFVYNFGLVSPQAQPLVLPGVKIFESALPLPAYHGQ